MNKNTVQNSSRFIFYLAGLSMLGYLAIDMYLPAFGIMQISLNSSEGEITASLSIFLAGFAFGQLLWGSLSDKLGRKPVLIFGLSLFMLSCFATIWVTDATQLLVLRFVQALGVCAAAVLWQALVIDRYQPAQAQKVFATIMPLVALSPALAPLIGAWVIELTRGNWHYIFLILALVTLLLLIPTLWLKKVQSQPHNTVEKQMTSWLNLVKSPVFSGNVLVYASCSAGFFAWLTGSPFILHNMGYHPADIGLSYIPQTIAFIVGGYGCRFVLTKISGERLLPMLLIGYALSMLILLLISLYMTANLLIIMIPFCFMAAMNGASYPIVVAKALGALPESSGKAAALQNSLQLGLCFLASLLVSALAKNPLIATTSVMAATIIPMIIGYILQYNSNVSKSELAKNELIIE